MDVCVRYLHVDTFHYNKAIPGEKRKQKKPMLHSWSSFAVSNSGTTLTDNGEMALSQYVHQFRSIVG